jgi:hypothetical protein
MQCGFDKFLQITELLEYPNTRGGSVKQGLEVLFVHSSLAKDYH